MTLVIALIPARSGSKGVPDKNIKKLGGHTLIDWSVAVSLRCNLIDRTLISTDSHSYRDHALDCGAEAPFIRPAALAADHSTDLEFIVQALDWLAKNETEPDFVVHIRPTTPFRDPAIVDSAIRRFMGEQAATSLRSVHEMPESAYKTFEITQTGRLKRVGMDSTSLDDANNARQTFPTTYFANGYVDVLSVPFIRKANLLHGDNVCPFVTPAVTEVDLADDFERLEYELHKNASLEDKVFGRVE